MRPKTKTNSQATTVARDAAKKHGFTEHGFPLRRRSDPSMKGSKIPWDKIRQDYVFGCICSDSKRGWPTIADLARMYGMRSQDIHRAAREGKWQEMKMAPTLHPVIERTVDECRRVSALNQNELILVIQNWCFAQLGHEPGTIPRRDELAHIPTSTVDKVVEISQKCLEMMLLSGGSPTQIVEHRADLRVEQQMSRVSPEVVRAMERALVLGPAIEATDAVIVEQEGK
jgi:hypothetical protein